MEKLRLIQEEVEVSLVVSYIEFIQNMIVDVYTLPARGPPASFLVHMVSSSVTPVVYVHKTWGDNVVRM